ncbi:TPA: LOW QUALITY PROTEIN: hypothetical protein N0F65_002283, partial [Lagenidium giganteum]
YSWKEAAVALEPADAFVYAASRNQLQVLERWISKKHDVNARDSEGNLALCAAAQSQSVPALELLLAHGALVDNQQSNVRMTAMGLLDPRLGQSAMHVACTWGRMQVVELLLAHGTSIHLRDSDVPNVSYWCCHRAADSCTYFLGQTPLHGACKNNHADVVEVLIRCGVDLFIADDCGMTPLDYARAWQRPQIVQMLEGRATVEMLQHKMTPTAPVVVYQREGFRDASVERVDVLLDVLDLPLDMPLLLREVLVEMLC